MTIKLDHCLDLRLFAEAQVVAEGISGEKKASDAGKHSTGDKDTAPDAGERSERFRTLIRGEFKDLYDAEVQNIVKQRLKGSEETMKKYKALSPALRILEKKYGVAEGDAQALSEALQKRELEGSEQRRERMESAARRQHDMWLAQASRLKAQRSDFDLKKELEDGRFRSLLKGGASLRDAYELIHRGDIMAQAAREMEEKISRRVLSGTMRPREGGLSAQSAAVMKSDVAHMSKKARQDIIRRVQQGEKISF